MSEKERRVTWAFRLGTVSGKIPGLHSSRKVENTYFAIFNVIFPVSSLLYQQKYSKFPFTLFATIYLALRKPKSIAYVF